jgi:Microtubule associated protein (MAP65/ASE1 family)
MLKRKHSIQAARKRIADLWEILMLSKRETSAFPDYATDDYSKETEEAYRKELDRLNAIYDGNKAVYELAEKRRNQIEWLKNPDLLEMVCYIFVKPDTKLFFIFY